MSTTTTTTTTTTTLADKQEKTALDAQADAQADAHSEVAISPLHGDNAADAMEVVSEAELNDPANLVDIEKSIHYKEILLRTKHAQEMAEMFRTHKQKPPTDEDGEEGAAGAEGAAEKKAADEAETKAGSQRLALALKEQARQEKRLHTAKCNFARNKVLHKRRKIAKANGAKAAENSEEKAMMKAVALALKKTAKKSQETAEKAALAAMKELPEGLSEEEATRVADKAYKESMAKQMAKQMADSA